MGHRVGTTRSEPNGEVKRRADLVGICLTGVLVLEQNDKWAVGGRYMALESLTVLSDDLARSLSAVAA